MSGLEIAALGMAGYGAYSGIQGAKQQQKAIEGQRTAQDEARSAAIKQEAENEMSINKANRKQPDLGALLASAQAGSKLGAASTMLTGPQSVKPTSLLGA